VSSRLYTGSGLGSVTGLVWIGWCDLTLTDASASGSGERALFVDIRPIDVQRTGDDDLVGRVQTGAATIDEAANR
jgi:hypothetical protein